MKTTSGKNWLIGGTAAALVALSATAALAQANRQNTRGAPAQGGRNGQQAAGAAAAAPAPVVGEPVMKRTFVNPTDPICIVNGEVITRERLANECVARRGEEILDSLIARTLIDQALKANKMEVTAAEVEAEIDRIAMTLAHTTRELWLSSLAKDRGISPAQYARDIIYPALALRKLAQPRVQVTDQDIKDAFESQFGEKLIYRMIVTKSLQHANELFNELQKNPGGFENIARNDFRSVDPTTKPAGGQPMEHMRRHSYPREATDRVFQQLVDGDPNDKNPEHEPKDGTITGPIQIAEGAWILVKREGLIPADKYNPNDPAKLETIKAAIVDSKMQQHMELVMAELVQGAAIENRLKGTVKTANREVPMPTVEQQKELGAKAAERNISSAPASTAKTDASVTATQAAIAAKRSIPKAAGVTEADAKLRKELEASSAEPPPAYNPNRDPELPKKK